MKKPALAKIRVLDLFGSRFLPFADAVSEELPLGRLLRLSLFQVSIGIALVLLNSTLNRVMVVELGLPASLVGIMIALPVIFAPLRALIGFRSDNHRSVIGWRRAPYVWIGTMLQFGGLALMPMALIILSEGRPGTMVAGTIGAGLAFILTGAGMHTIQTAGLALALDLSPERTKPRVIAVLYAVLLASMAVGSLVIGALLRDFTPMRLLEVLKGAALVTVALDLVSIWGQEPRRPSKPEDARKTKPRLRDSWHLLKAGSQPIRLLAALALGTAAFGMQDVLLEPYGGQALGMSVGETTLLTATSSAGTLVGFVLAARLLGRRGDPHAVAALGALCGIPAFCAVIFAAPFGSVALLQGGAGAMGLGAGLFAVAMLSAVMGLADGETSGFALGLWGTVQASASGAAIAVGGALRDLFSHLAASGVLGPGLDNPLVGYGFVYHLELCLIFATLVVLGPLVTFRRGAPEARGFGLADMPG